MRTIALTLLTAAAFSILAPAAMLAQEQPMPIVWVNSLQAKPGQSQSLTAMLIEQGAKSYDPLIESGAVINWGVAMNVVHDGNDPSSHVEWVTFPNWAALDQFMAAFMAAMQTTTPEEQAEMDAQWDANVVDGSHADMINYAPMIGSPPRGRPSYINLAYFEAMPGKEEAATGLWKQYVAPMFQKLVDDDTILAYGIHLPAVHRNQGWSHLGWYSSSNLKARSAVDAALAGIGPEMYEQMGEVFTDNHVDQILMVVHFNEAAAE